MAKTDFKCMKDLDLFSSLNEEEKKRIVQLAKSRYFKKGEMLFSEGEPLNAIYLICYGQVWITKISEGGKEIILDILDAGGIIGENTFLEELECNINARAEQDTMVCICDTNDLYELLKNTDIAVKLIKSLSQKINQYSNNIADLSFCDVRERVLNLIKRLSEKYGIKYGDGLLLSFYISHDEIAQMVNASRVMVTNVIKSLKEEAYIDVIDRRFLLFDSAFAIGA